MVVFPWGYITGAWHAPVYGSQGEGCEGEYHQLGCTSPTSPRRMRAKYTHRTNLRFVLCVFRPCRGQIYASVNYKCCRIYAYAGHGKKFVNGCLSIHSRWQCAIIISKKGGNAYCKKFIYSDVKADKSERQNQLYIEQSQTGKFVCSL